MAAGELIYFLANGSGLELIAKILLSPPPVPQFVTASIQYGLFSVVHLSSFFSVT